MEPTPHPAGRMIGLMLWLSLFVAALAYPLHQWLQAGHHVYYVNGFDEFAYLQADFSRAAQSLLRPGQYLVSLGHAAGLSGGKLNALADAGALALFPLVCRAIFGRLGWPAGRAWSAAIALTAFPVALGAINPAIKALLDWNEVSGAIAWLSVPEMPTPAILRTPEPQFSLLLLAVGVWLALRRRSPGWVYPALIFMYPFVAFPAAFALMACHLQARWPEPWRARTAGPLAAAFGLIAVPAAVYFRWGVDAGARTLLVPSHLPLVSFTGLAATGLWLLTRQRMAAPMRFPALAIALAPWAACNQQLISGYVGQPSNFEQYAGTFAFTLVALLTTERLPRWRAALVAVGMLFFLRSSYVTFRTNQATNDRLPLTPELATALRTEPQNVVVNDIALASVLSMVQPNGGSTALGMENIYGKLADRHVAAYRCIKHQALAEHPDDRGLRHAFAGLDVGYAYSGTDAVKVHIKRRTTFQPLRDVTATACSPRPLRYYLLP